MPSHYAGPATEVEALSAFINLMRASDSVAGVLQTDMTRNDLTPSQFGVLETLLHRGPLFQGELSQKLLRCTGSITSVVAGLERKGMVERRRESQDKRYVRVSLTAKGRKAIDKVFPEHVRAVVRLFGSLTRNETGELRRVCAKLGKFAQQRR
ncbi:MAG TPA: MarR family transcriptional regulator [Gemmatimonadales bacterium]|jgi:MarR family 2-MHQ and catechol resistance regulon transcriptional repressor|nr:MarR family transcriptional regulator [Gemmatimonadales bacterium]